jgi:hypothetical protein
MHTDKTKDILVKYESEFKKVISINSWAAANVLY